jgi:3-methyladenine DNA glycosylase/8-oxoguanine DNA glycosylase
LQPHEVGRALGLEEPLEIERRTSAWRPWRAYAAVYLAARAAPEPQASLRNSPRKSSTSASVVM